MQVRSPRLILFALTIMLGASLPSAAFAGTSESFTIELTGDQVVPGPGDEDGGGGVFMTLDRKSGEFCFYADTGNISTPLSGVHLHRAPAGEVGPIVVELHGPSSDTDVSGCLNLGSELVRDISRNKDDYYIDFHNDEFPEGAIRGQLG